MTINIMELILEVTVGRLVLSLPNEDLVKINKMILKHLERLCPKCGTKLKRVHQAPDYYMCFKCIKGYNLEELKGKDET